MQKVLLAVIALLIIVGGSFYFLKQRQSYQAEQTDQDKTVQPAVLPVEPDSGIGDGAAPLPEEKAEPISVIGRSVAGNDITAYHFGTGQDELLLIAGVHGAYAANTSELAHELMTYLDSTAAIPENVKVTVIPVLNPDGLKEVGGVTDVVAADGAVIWKAPANHADTVVGRFNANEVDLNRNFDCEWSETSMWQNKEVSGGSAAFSEPEAQALRGYIDTYNPKAAIVWFSAEGKVYPSACGDRSSSISVAMANTFGTAAGYPVEPEFDAYKINGDMVNWMAKEGIPAISVLLSNYTSTELSKNKAGLDAVLSSLKK